MYHLSSKLVVQRALILVTLVATSIGRDLNKDKPLERSATSQSAKSAVADGAQETVYDAIKKMKASKFLDLIEKSSVKNILTSKEDVTVFVPSDNYMNTVPNDVLNYVSNNKELLDTVMKYHIVEGKQELLKTDDNKEVYLPTTHDGTGIWIRKYGDILTANGFPLTKPDQIASNGVVQEMEGFFLPIPEGKTDKLLETAPLFQQFFTLVKKSGLLEEYFEGDEPYTVFVPVNSAFYKLPYRMYHTISNNPGILKEFILQHVVKGIHYTSSLGGNINELKTVGGTTLKLKEEEGKYYVNNAEIGLSDVTTLNGVIHAIGEVITPTRDYIESRAGRPQTEIGIGDKPTSTGITRRPIVPVRPLQPRPRPIPPQPTPNYPVYPGYPGGVYRPRPTFRPRRPPVVPVIPRRPIPERPNAVSPDLGTPYNGFGPSSIDGRTFVSADEAHSQAIDDMVIQARRAGFIP